MIQITKMKIHQAFAVKFNYDIYFTENMFSNNGRIFSEIFKDKNSKIMVFIDSGVADKHTGIVKQISAWFKKNQERGAYISPVRVPGGERCKCDRKTQRIIGDSLRIHGLDRHSFVIIIGGGAVLDTVGYIASITHRGIRQVRIPTTVLSQCDSGVGVKTGINYYNTKNYFGTFTPPYAVINDFRFIRSLGVRDILSGVAEAFKVAIIKDKTFLNFLARNGSALKKQNAKAIKKMISHSAELHADHIAKGDDPFEMGSARPLDFGHWSGHYIETLTGYTLKHGESVVLGLMIDMIIARELKLVTVREFNKVLEGLKAWDFKLWHPILEKREKNGKLSIANGLEEFRQHIGGELNLVMPDGLGKSCLLKSISAEQIETAVKEMKNENTK
ncbi:MAG TPA: 3-dehydroquinate synthase [Candidatus Brocadiaceae bacterium]